MKRSLFLIPVILIAMLSMGINQCELSGDEGSHKAGAYLAGKAMVIGLYEVLPVKADSIDTDLTRDWKAMMERNKNNKMVPAEELMLFYNDSMTTISLHADDPYGLIGDLGALLAAFGGEFSIDGEIIKLDPMPLPVLTFFGSGFRNGRRVAVARMGEKINE